MEMLHPNVSKHLTFIWGVWGWNGSYDIKNNEIANEFVGTHLTNVFFVKSDHASQVRTNIENVNQHVLILYPSLLCNDFCCLIEI